MMGGRREVRIQQQMCCSPSSLEPLSSAAAHCQSNWHLKLYSLRVVTIKSMNPLKPPAQLKAKQQSTEMPGTMKSTNK